MLDIWSLPGHPSLGLDFVKAKAGHKSHQSPIYKVCRIEVDCKYFQQAKQSKEMNSKE
jgi:hypothetical protein